MELDPNDLDIGQRYRLMISSIIPRPIAFVSTISLDGELNLAPYSFFTGAGAEPMTVLFCPGNLSDGSEKDTLRNCKPVGEGGTGEFVVNIAREKYRRQVSAAAEPLPHGESEFELVNLAPAASSAVCPPRLADSPVAFECRTQQVIRLGEGRPAAANVVIGKVVHIYVDEAVLSDRLTVDPEKLQAVGRLGGVSYCSTRDRFEIPRGKAALDSMDE